MDGPRKSEALAAPQVIMKPISTIILDAGPIIQNNPSVSTCLAQSECLMTVPSVLNEIKDSKTRDRVETTLIPFLTLRSPSPSSLKFVSGFARRTGDLSVLSQTDLEILALAYELECSLNGGDWRLRREPGQKQPNGEPPETLPGEQEVTLAKSSQPLPSVTESKPKAFGATSDVIPAAAEISEGVPETRPKQDEIPLALEKLSLQGEEGPIPIPENDISSQIDLDHSHISQQVEESDESDSEGWITPSNFKKHQAAESNAALTPTKQEAVMKVATVTTDFAMQNVLLQIGLNLVSPSLQRIRNVRTYILRCHACFEKVKDTSKQFCPRCGKPSLTRVTCSTNASGEFRLHLKKNMQWNHRGDRYSIPKPVSGSANGKVANGKGGGKGGWGQSLILAEDQKEFQKAINDGNRKGKGTDIMDVDYLPSILTGERRQSGQRPRVGAGRNVNSNKRR